MKSCYAWISNYIRGSAVFNEDPVVEVCGSVWKSDLPSKVLIFSWRLLMDKLPTRLNLHRKGVLTSHLELSCVFLFQRSRKCWPRLLQVLGGAFGVARCMYMAELH